MLEIASVLNRFTAAAVDRGSGAKAVSFGFGAGLCSGVGSGTDAEVAGDGVGVGFGVGVIGAGPSEAKNLVATVVMNLVPMKYEKKPIVSAPQKSLTDTLTGNCVSESRDATIVTVEPSNPAENAFRRKIALALSRLLVVGSDFQRAKSCPD